MLSPPACSWNPEPNRLVLSGKERAKGYFGSLRETNTSHEHQNHRPQA